MKRLFIALEIPQAIALNLSALRGGIAGARWIEPQDFHITLRFIGKVALYEEQRIAAQLRLLASPPVAVEIRGLNSFGRKRPRTIFAAVQSTPALMALQKQLERYIQLLGFDPELRKFTPHITLARLQRSPMSHVGHFCAQHSLAAHGDFIAAGFALYSARTSMGGGPYVIEERFEMAE